MRFRPRRAPDAPGITPNPQLGKDRTMENLMDTEALSCLTEVSERTGVPVKELASHVVRAWYEVNFDVTAPQLRAAIAQSKRDAAKWGTTVQA
jgi:hypothetical protein